MRQQKLTRGNLALIGFGTLSCLTVPAHATFHLWRIEEVYSDPTGTVQFIEFQQPNFVVDDERFLTEAGTVTDSTFGNTFTFLTNLPSAPTANSYFLMGTPGYAALSGVPAPDYTFATNNFFSISGDTITYAHGIDSLTFTAGQLPTDRVNSLYRAWGATTFTTGINTPTNFAGQTGTVVLLTWNNMGGAAPSDGVTWDIGTNNNWNHGTTVATYTDGSNVTFNDANGGAASYQVTLNTTVKPGSMNVNNSAGNYTISGSGSIAGTTGLSKSGTGSLTLDTVNSYAGGTNVNAGMLVAGVAGALPSGAVNVTGGTLQLASSIGGTTIPSLAVSGSGKFDINNDHVIINYGAGPDPIASIQAMLNSGYNGGAWNGATGITSSAVATNPGYGIGYADSADPGNPAGLSSGQMEIAFTLLGDTNLDHTVNGVDFGILAANFNKGITGWDNGDFNYDNVVNGVDFGQLAANFNKGAASASDIAALDEFAAANGLLAGVPEPTCGAMVLAAVVGAVIRRRSRRH